MVFVEATMFGALEIQLTDEFNLLRQPFFYRKCEAFYCVNLIAQSHCYENPFWRGLAFSSSMRYLLSFQFLQSLDYSTYLSVLPFVGESNCLAENRRKHAVNLDQPKAEQ
jgi:hypothetical protein